jgi:malate dehydrogenase (oxaloacetate-decarboxylating)
MHRINKGKLESKSKVAVRNAKDLSLAYSPGVAEPCKDIYEKPEMVYEYTMKGNMVAVVTDGTAVLGLGNIGQKLHFQLWKVKQYYSKALLALMPSQSA